MLVATTTTINTIANVNPMSMWLAHRLAVWRINHPSDSRPPTKRRTRLTQDAGVAFRRHASATVLAKIPAVVVQAGRQTATAIP